MTVDLSKCVIGFVSGFEEGKGRTGYQVKVLVRGLEHTFDATREVYEIRYTDKYFPYPCLGEILFLLHFDEKGILVELEDVNDLTDPDRKVKTGISMGTTRMFQKKITEDTLTFGDILKFEDNKIIFEHFDENNQSGKDMGENMEDTICALTYGGNIKKPYNGMELTMAPDCIIYFWDWSTATHPFCICSREQAKEWNFVEKFSLGTVEDIKRAYWLGMFSTRGDESKIDLIKCFPNKVPGWVGIDEI
ncbi:MAG: hypothetical protein ACI4LP_04380 [Anaerovoracaceae bacterium]